MAKFKAQGQKLYLGAAISKTQVDAIRNAASDAAAKTLYEAANPFVLIPEIQDRGDVGIKQNIITATDINTGLVDKEVTTRDPGDMSLTAFFDSSNTVIQSLKAAADAGFIYVFKLQNNDKSATSPSTPTLTYFAGIVAGFTFKSVNVDAWVTYDTTIALVTQPLVIPRT